MRAGPGELGSRENSQLVKSLLTTAIRPDISEMVTCFRLTKSGQHNAKDPIVLLAHFFCGRCRADVFRMSRFLASASNDRKKIRPDHIYATRLIIL
jgi:hypothetical protein